MVKLYTCLATDFSAAVTHWKSKAIIWNYFSFELLINIFYILATKNEQNHEKPQASGIPVKILAR
jgi:hypothetical protein